MRNEPNITVFRQAFSLRIEIAAALEGALDPLPEHLKQLKETCLKLGTIISELGKGEVEDQYRSYHTAINIFVLLAEWKTAIRNAESEAQRFLNSAKLKTSEIDISNYSTPQVKLESFIEQVNQTNNVGELHVIHNQLKHWDLPLLLFANLIDHRFDGLSTQTHNNSSSTQEKLETSVAFLKFNIDGEPAKNWNYLKPRTSYDLTIEVRVSNWPKGATILSLKPVTMDILEKDWLPSFIFERPDGDGPYTFTGTSRAALEIAQSFGSRPYEFLYAAEFDNMINCRNVAVIGHRRLLLEGCDVSSHPLTGFSNVDRHLLSIRNKVRALPGIDFNDIANTMIVLGGLGNIAAQALKNGIFQEKTSEQEFQSKATKILQNRNDIGEELQGHPEAAKGITDLIFRDITIELKVEKKKIIYPKDCTKFFNQTAAYAIGLGKRIGVLSVLETSPKAAPVGIVEDDIEVFFHSTGKTKIAIIVVIIRGGFPTPSSYSR